MNQDFRAPQDTKAIVERHPELLVETAERILNDLVGQARQTDNEELANYYDLHRELLWRCHEVGIHEAFRPLIAPHESLACAGEDLLGERLQASVEAPTWPESREMVERHPELLSHAGDRLLEQWLAEVRVQGDVRRVVVLEQRRALLRRCRLLGIAEAFTSLGMLEDFLWLISQFVQIPVDEMRCFLDTHPELLSEDANRHLDMLVRMMESQGEPFLAARIKIARRSCNAAATSAWKPASASGTPPWIM
jgi:hypothetical protein